LAFLRKLVRAKAGSRNPKRDTSYNRKAEKNENFAENCFWWQGERLDAMQLKCLAKRTMAKFSCKRRLEARYDA
jgi:hypothetical protein